MSREIKFRAWDKDDKEMFTVRMISWIEGKGMILSGKGGSISGSDCELMQFTGLKDKNGVEIYEGDILDTKDYLDAPFVVRWGASHTGHATSMAYGFDMGGYAPYFVIGNIYQNPELLK